MSDGLEDSRVVTGQADAGNYGRPHFVRTTQMIDKLENGKNASKRATTAGERQSETFALANEDPTVAKPNEFLDDEHSLGCEIRRIVSLTIIAILLIGRELSVAFDLFSKRGRGSLYPLFLATYLPTVDRKTADRWRLAYSCFRTLVSLDDNRTQCPEMEKIRLTAVYRLCRGDATPAHREAALALARNGVVVTQELAASLVRGDRGPVPPTSPRKTRSFEVPNGKVSVRVDDGDIFLALTKALALVKDDCDKK